MILALDPSISATGWVIYDPIEKTILTVGAYKQRPEAGVSKTQVKINHQRNYAEWLLGVVNQFSVTKIVCEFPHGSQSSAAAWALSMVTSVVSTVAITKEIPVKFYLESQVKKFLLDKAKRVTKSEITNYVLAIFPEISYIPDMNVKYKREAISDALAVLATNILSK
jgi:Holliday junction resolvasome RuvABC endonuclease subunit